MAKRITLTWADETTLSFIDPFYAEEDLTNGEWSAPYPNIVEDSQVFGLMEGWAQGEGFVTSLCYEKGEPIKTVIESVPS